MHGDVAFVVRPSSAPAIQMPWTTNNLYVQLPIPGNLRRTWPSVEHYYQAQKFAGSSHADSAAVVEAVAVAGSPEEAARLGRATERARPELLTPGWATVKVRV